MATSGSGLDTLDSDLEGLREELIACASRIESKKEKLRTLLSTFEDKKKQLEELAQHDLSSRITHLESLYDSLRALSQSRSGNQK